MDTTLRVVQQLRSLYSYRCFDVQSAREVVKSDVRITMETRNCFP